jgi:hypothetical protein
MSNLYVRSVAEDTFSLGILISYILSGTMLIDAASLVDWPASPQQPLPDSISRRLYLLPSSNLREFVFHLLRQPDDGVDLIARLNGDCFPHWFGQVHSVLSMFYMLSSWSDRMSYALQVCAFVSFFLFFFFSFSLVFPPLVDFIVLFSFYGSKFAVLSPPSATFD